MMRVEETSAGLMGYRPLFKGTVAPISATYELALHGNTLNDLRRIAKHHGLGIIEAIEQALDDWIQSNGHPITDGPGQVIAAHQQALETGRDYP